MAMSAQEHLRDRDKNLLDTLFCSNRAYALGRYGEGFALTISTANLISSFGLRKS